MRKLNLGFYIFIAITLMALFAGNSLYENDVENNISRDIFNYTDSQLNWNSSNFELAQYNNTNNNTNESFYNFRIQNTLNYGINGLGGAIFEYCKMFIEIGYKTQGEYDLGMFLSFLRFVFWIMVVGILFMPALYIGIGIYELTKYIKTKVKEKQKED